MSDCSTFRDYTTGQLLKLNALPDHGFTSAGVMSLRIRQIHTKTLSCTMVVDIENDQPSTSKSATVFLKLFDRRFAAGLRRCNGVEPWTKSMEQAYIESVNNRTVYTFLHDLRHVENFQRDTEEDWNDAENEAFLAHECIRMYTAELSVYHELRNHQGHLVPRLIAPVHFDLATSNDYQSQTGNDDFAPFQVQGLVLEYLKGCSLLEIADHFPRSSWQHIVDQALVIVDTLDVHNILNNDVDPRNFLVCIEPQHDIPHNLHVFMIDFALCRFRAPDESDAEWGCTKFTKDEKGAVGLRMKKVLLEHDYELRYEDNLKYLQWADREE